MASSTQKKTTTKKSGSRSGSRTAKGKQPQKRPIRREVGGVILLVLALCVLVSYCGVQAILIDLLAKLLKGLFGYGYWLAGPAMLLAGGILLLHPGPPVTLRTTCALLLPLLAGALFHTIFAGGDYALNGWGVLKNLWTAGLALKAGGAVSGLLAEAAVLAVSKVVSLFLFGLLLAVLLLAALHVTPSAVLEMVRNRPEYEEEPEPTPPSTSLLRSRPSGGESARAGPPSTFPWTARSRPHSRRKSPAGLPASSGISPTR